MDKQIKNSIDGIEPDNEAKNRMYANIMKKAAQNKAEEKPQKKSVLRFINYALPVAACICIAVFAVSLFKNNVSVADSDSEPLVQTTPSSQDDWLFSPNTAQREDFEKTAPLPDMPTDASDISYGAADDTVWVDFVSNQTDYRLYASKTDSVKQDGNIISSEKYTLKNGTETEMIVFENDGAKAIQLIWDRSGVHYCLYAETEDKEAVKAVAEITAE